MMLVDHFGNQIDVGVVIFAWNHKHGQMEYFVVRKINPKTLRVQLIPNTDDIDWFLRWSKNQPKGWVPYPLSQTNFTPQERATVVVGGIAALPIEYQQGLERLEAETPFDFELPT